MLLLDEADELFSRGFGEQLNEMTSVIPTAVQTIMNTTTLPPGLISYCSQHLKVPVAIFEKREELTLDGGRHYYVTAQREE